MQLFTSEDLALTAVNSNYFMNLPHALTRELEKIVKKESWAISDHIFSLIEHLMELMRKKKCVQVICESKLKIKPLK